MKLQLLKISHMQKNKRWKESQGVLLSILRALYIQKHEYLLIVLVDLFIQGSHMISVTKMELLREKYKQQIDSLADTL